MEGSKGGLFMNDQRGDRFIGLPFASPHRLGDTPRPRNGVMIKWDDSKNAIVF